MSKVKCIHAGYCPATECEHKAEHEAIYYCGSKMGGYPCSEQSTMCIEAEDVCRSILGTMGEHVEMLVVDAVCVPVEDKGEDES